jgi:hypothetical protein
LSLPAVVRTTTSPPLSQPVLALLQHLHTYPQKTKSDLAREAAEVIAEAASRSLITTEVVPGSSVFGTIWKVTILGLYELKQGAQSIMAEELAAYREAPQGRYFRDEASDPESQQALGDLPTE